MTRHLIYSVCALALSCVMTKAERKPGKDETKLTKILERTFAVSEGAQLEVINKYGQVVIDPWEKDSVQVKVEVIAYGKDQSSASKIMERVDIEFRKYDRFLRMETLLDRKSGFFKELWNNIGDYSKTLLSKNKLEINYEIKVPQRIRLDLINKFGDVFLGGFSGKARIELSHGTLRAHELASSSELAVNFGDARIKKFGGGDLIFKASEVNISELTDSKIRSSSSTVVIKKAEQVRINSRNDKLLNFGWVNHLSGTSLFSKITIDELSKSLDLQMDYGEVTIHRVQFSFSKINIEGKSTDVVLNFEPKTFLDIDIQGKDELIVLPTKQLKLDKQFTDDKEKYVKITGQLGQKNNYPGLLFINSHNGEVDINFGAPGQTANR